MPQEIVRVLKRKGMRKGGQRIRIAKLGEGKQESIREKRQESRIEGRDETRGD